MQVQDFCDWADISSTYKLNRTTPWPYLSHMLRLTEDRTVWHMGLILTVQMLATGGTGDNGYLTMHLQNAFHEDCVTSLENARMVVQNATAGRKRMQLCNVSWTNGILKDCRKLRLKLQSVATPTSSTDKMLLHAQLATNTSDTTTALHVLNNQTCSTRVRT